MRTLIVLAGKVNIHSLQLQVENLKLHILNEIYKKGNYSIADATFYINTLSGHLSYFYGALAGITITSFRLLFMLFFNIRTFNDIIVCFRRNSYVSQQIFKKSKHYMYSSYTFAQETGRDIQRVIQNLFLIKI